MCGIVGYLGQQEAVSILMTGLRELEYRGYDSAGIAILQSDGFHSFKAVGKLDQLAAKLGDFHSQGAVAGIGHTRWATHGKPTEANAHPHGLTHSQVVHNGIIENYVDLKATVTTPYLSQTDSEVIVHLFENRLAALQKNQTVEVRENLSGGTLPSGGATPGGATPFGSAAPGGATPVGVTLGGAPPGGATQPAPLPEPSPEAPLTPATATATAPTVPTSTTAAAATNPLQNELRPQPVLGAARAEQVLAAFRATLAALSGAYAILLVTEHAPGQIFFARKGSPLQVGLSSAGCYFASSDAAMVGVCPQAIYLEDGQWGVATSHTVQLFGPNGEAVAPEWRALPLSTQTARKEGFRFFMEKEIHEQPRVLTDILMGRIHDGAVVLEECPPDWLRGFRSVTLCACGTSYHAALVGSYLFERLSGIPARVEIASEFRYREPVLDPAGLFLVISQSGETADTLEALKLAKAQGIATLGLCNVDNSTIVREAGHALLLRAGIEKGVASTKAFSAQVLTLWLLALYWADLRARLSPETRSQELAAVRASLAAVAVPPSLAERLHRLAKRYLHGHGFFFIGRDLFYPLALEGALKLKEISYLHAEGYPAGEMKHGPIALADPELFTVALLPRTLLFEKMKSNVEELAARDATIIAISSEPFALADDLITIQAHPHPMLEFFEMLVALQLLALEIAVRLGNDVDMPRNLAKSVTVE